MVSLTKRLQSSSLTTSAAITNTCLAPRMRAFSLMPNSRCSLLATKTKLAFLLAYSYAICCIWEKMWFMHSNMHACINKYLYLINNPNSEQNMNSELINQPIKSHNCILDASFLHRSIGTTKEFIIDSEWIIFFFLRKGSFFI